MTDKHISSQFENELHVVSAQLIELGSLVDAQICQTIEALSHFDAKGAQRVLAAEVQVNRLEADIDHEITTIIARRQPAARDLRLLMAISKASGSLERVGNEADKMARKVLNLVGGAAKRMPSPHDLDQATRLATGLLRASLEAFARLDLAAAMEVLKEDDPVYQEVEALVQKLIVAMIEKPQIISMNVDLISLAESLELILDHAKHIAELVIYVVQGADVRHTPVEQIKSLLS